MTEQCECEALSNSNLTRKYQLNPLIINVQRRDVALAHKIAAWNERNLCRDLFDIYFFVSVLGVTPHIPTLKQRLKNVFRGRVNKVVGMGLDELCENLLAAKEKLSAESVAKELRALLPASELLGLDLKIRVAFEQLVRMLKE